MDKIFQEALDILHLGYSTLNPRIQCFKLHYKVFDDIIEFLQHKGGDSMQPEDDVI